MTRGRVSVVVGRRTGELGGGCAVALQPFEAFKAGLQRCGALGVFVLG